MGSEGKIENDLKALLLPPAQKAKKRSTQSTWKRTCFRANAATRLQVRARFRTSLRKDRGMTYGADHRVPRAKASVRRQRSRFPGYASSNPPFGFLSEKKILVRSSKFFPPTMTSLQTGSRFRKVRAASGRLIRKQPLIRATKVRQKRTLWNMPNKKGDQREKHNCEADTALSAKSHE